MQRCSHDIKNSLCFVFCAVSLQICYISWGVLQERVTRHEYNGKKFHNSQFLVLMNKLLALIISTFHGVFFVNKPTSNELFSCSLSAISNVVSSWLQYEALKYLHYSLHVLTKSCKIIPVMITSWILSRKKYSKNEWVQASVITIGMAIFLTKNPNDVGDGKKIPQSSSDTIGILLMLGYMATDSFTSTWQSQLFKDYPDLSFMTVMLGMNLCGFIFILFSMIFTNSLLESVQFVLEHPEFGIHCFILSLTSAIGQIFIYFTIKKFGAVSFVMIMTVKQILSISTNCMIYGHVFDTQAIIGIVIVFTTLGYRAYSNISKEPRGLKKHN